LIDGSAIAVVEGRNMLKRESFDACQERLRELQEYLKK